MVWKCLFFWKSSPKKYANFHTIFGFVGFCRSYCGSCGLIYFKKPNLCRRFCEVINGQDQLGHFNGYNIRIISLSVISVQTHLSNKPPQNQTSLIAIWRTRQDSCEVGSTQPHKNTKQTQPEPTHHLAQAKKNKITSHLYQLINQHHSSEPPRYNQSFKPYEPGAELN